MDNVISGEDRESIVPCAGYTRCCRNDALRLLPGDDPDKYQTVPHPYFTGMLMLDHRDDGACIYLGMNGCTIYADRPRMCREMDCRNLARVLTFTQARKLEKHGKLRVEIWKRGKELIKVTA